MPVAARWMDICTQHIRRNKNERAREHAISRNAGGLLLKFLFEIIDDGKRSHANPQTKTEE